jgi:hypothetical protein
VVISHSRPLLLAAALLLSITACGTSASGSSSKLPVIKFVGSSACPTSGASPYNTNDNGQPVPPAVNSYPPVGEPVDEMPHNHVAPPTQITYNHNPPTSGCHYSQGFGVAPIQNGVYDRPIQNEYWVHNLEHGYIVVLYNCPSGCAPQFAQLRQWYKGLQPDASQGVAYAKVIVLPDPTLPVPFAAECWDWYYPIPVFSIAEVQKFYANHVGHPPEPGVTP